MIRLSSGFLIFFTIILQVNAVTDTTTGVFFKTLEDSLRSDYSLCTGDTTTLPLRDLIAWRILTDSIITSAAYKSLIKQYIDLTRRAHRDVKPCEVASWKINHDRSLEEINNYLALDKLRRTRAYEDSMTVMKELALVRKNRIDFNGIPFGISKQSFKWCFLKKNCGTINDEGMYFKADTVIIDKRWFSAAFHFDDAGKFCAYEIESYPCISDSLDENARDNAIHLSAYFEKLLGTPPEHTYRIGLFDIVQGRLSIMNSWTSHNAPVWVGLATYKYRYYAKAVVQP